MMAEQIEAPLQTHAAPEIPKPMPEAEAVYALALNVGLSLLFFFLTITFMLLAAGVTHPKSNKVRLHS